MKEKVQITGHATIVKSKMGERIVPKTPKRKPVDDQVVDKINEIKDIFKTQINCYLIAMILRNYFEGLVLYDGDHVIFVYHEWAFDDTGKIGNRYEPKFDNYFPMSLYGVEHDKDLFDGIGHKYM